MTPRISIADAPEAVQRAFDNVRTYFPSVTNVLFESNADFHGWTYREADGHAPNFDEAEGIDVDLLEYALDAVETFPVVLLRGGLSYG